MDVHTGRNWAIRHNLFKNIRAPQGELAGPAVLMWNNTQNSIVEGNTFIECQRGISLGLIDRTPNDHVGGIIRNNFFYRSSSLSGDAPIFVGDSPGTKVLHNTIIASGTYPSAIEYRFADATNVLIANNLSDAAIQPRDGASGVERNNMTSATASLFVNAAGGDLHLTSGASAVIDQAEMEADASDDWDSTARPQGNAVDIGADEYESEAPVTPLPATPPPFTDEQINPDTDLEYLGAFKMPMGAIGSSSWSYGGNGMTYYPGGDPLGDTDGFPGSLYGVGHVYQAQVSEINIPAPVISPSKNLNDLPRAQTLQPFVDITGGMQSPSLTSLAVGDIQYLPKQGQQGTDKLYWVMYEYYMPDVDDEFGFGWSELDLSNIDPKGSWRLNGVVSAAGQKYLFEIPQAVADTYFGGKNLAAGRSRIVNGGSWGPALFAFAPWAEGNPPPSGATLDAVTLLSYSAGWGSPDDPNYRKLTNYGHADDWVDGAWLTLEGKSAVIFVGTKPAMTMGNGEYYGAPRPEGCGDKGWHGEPYSSAILFYDTSELIAVSQEAMQPYEPQPYAIIDVENLMFNNSCNAEQLGGVGYDRTNNLLYVMEKKVQEDYEQAQVIHVWHLIDQNPVPVINSISIQ